MPLASHNLYLRASPDAVSINEDQWSFSKGGIGSAYAREPPDTCEMCRLRFKAFHRKQMSGLCLQIRFPNF